MAGVIGVSGVASSTSSYCGVDRVFRFDDGEESLRDRLSKGLGRPSWETTRLNAGPDLLLVAKILGVPMGQYISTRS